MTETRSTGCKRCGNCCRQPGYVYLQAWEVEAIAVSLQLAVADFTEIFTRLTPDRQGLSLVEKSDGACIFLVGRDCGIQAVKPRQCRDFPLKWRYAGWQTTCAGDYDL